jgi:transcriptional regulator with XRE-family HTH domain
MNDAMRQTLKARREQRGLSLEVMADGVAGQRAQEGRKDTFSHVTVHRLENGEAEAPRGGWDELVADYARVLDTTYESIWREAISRWEAAWQDTPTP